MNTLPSHFTNTHDRGFTLLGLLLATAGVCVRPACAQEALSQPGNKLAPGAIEIEGDSLQLRFDRQLRAVGHAIIRKNGQQVTGDDIRYDVQNDELQVEGNAVIAMGQTKISGPALRMRLSESLGEMRDVSVEFSRTAPVPDDQNRSTLLNDDAILISDPKRYLEDNQAYSTRPGKAAFDTLRANAAQVLFEGQDVKRLKSARYTTCAANVDDWYIKSSEMELNDYTRTAKANHAYVEFKGVPILYTPYLSFSYNNQRKSGFLSPLVGSTSRSGFEVLTPYYFNIAPDMDATIATRLLSKRGLQVQGEFRYLGEQYSGINSLEYLDNDISSGMTRYYAKLTHDQKFSDYWSAGYNYERVSDDRYFSEMATRIVVTSRVNLQQAAFVNYEDEHLSFNGTVQRYQNLDGRNFVYQRLPQLTLTYENAIKGFEGKLATQYVYFDSIAGMGDVATGSRFIVNPSLAYPMKNEFGFLTPKLSIHSTQYSLNNNIPTGSTQEFNQIQRTLPIFSIDGGLYLDRKLELGGINYTNTLEPRVLYVYAPYKDQSKIPVFDSSLATLSNDTLFLENQFNGGDRINNANQITLAVTSRLINADSGIERLSATIGQRFYFDDLRVVLPDATPNDRRSSDFLAGVTARLSNRLNVDSYFQYDPELRRVQRNNLLLRYNPEPGKSMSLGYRYTADSLEQFDVAGQWPLGNRWYGIGRMNYSMRDSNIVQSLMGFEYDAGCWQGRAVMQRVQTATANANFALFFQLELGGLTSIGADPLNIIKRNVPSYMRSSDIPTSYRDLNAQ